MMIRVKENPITITAVCAQSPSIPLDPGSGSASWKSAFASDGAASLNSSSLGAESQPGLFQKQGATHSLVSMAHIPRQIGTNIDADQ